MMVNTADITGTRTAGVSEHTYSFLPRGQVSGGGFLFSALGGPFNFRELLWRINHKVSSQGCRHREVMGWPALLELLSHHALSEVCADAKCVQEPSACGSHRIKQSSSETCLLARDALSAWVASIPKFLRQVSALKSLLSLGPLECQ